MSGRPKQARSVARLAAVQALYQMEVSGVGVEAVIREFSEHRFDRGLEGEESAPLAAADEAFFADLVRGVVSTQREIDSAIVKRLATGWRLERLDKTMLQILRAGTYELLARADVTVGTAISEYVDVAHAFFDEREAKFVNGVLDAVAKSAR